MIQVGDEATGEGRPSQGGRGLKPRKKGGAIKARESPSAGRARIETGTRSGLIPMAGSPSVGRVEIGTQIRSLRCIIRLGVALRMGTWVETMRPGPIGQGIVSHFSRNAWIETSDPISGIDSSKCASLSPNCDNNMSSINYGKP